MNFIRLISYLVICTVNTVSAAEYYVNTTGNDTSGDGSLASPWATLEKGVNTLTEGDTLYISAGTYAERLQLNNLTGTAVAPILVTNYDDGDVIIDGTTLTVPDSGSREGLISIEDCDYVHIDGLTVQNYETEQNGRVPVGIQIEGSGNGIEVRNCTVTKIWQSSTNGNANGFGISVYGTSSTPIDGLVLKGNTVHNLRTGQSESVVINGNVTNFLVTKNHVYDCNNIGIDFIGYEGSAPAAYDRARDGVCSENLVHDIDSTFNPGYGGSFTAGGGDRSAAGIYVDGGTNIVIERNRVYGCNYGIEMAAEDPNGFTDHIVMRNNLVHHNMQAGIIMGGYDRNRGVTRYCEVLNNTIYMNDTLDSYSGEVAFQFYLEHNTFKNNIIWANPTTRYAVLQYVEGGNATQESFDPVTNTFDYNTYYCTGGTVEFGFNINGANSYFSGLPAWRAALGGAAVGDDVTAQVANPNFVLAAPIVSSAEEAFKLGETSSCKDAGEPTFTPAVGEADYFGSSRVASSRVDVGFHESMSDLQSWRDAYFGAPDGGAGTSANDSDDPDHDGVANLMEYSQGMNPTQVDNSLAPTGQKTGNTYRYQYRKDRAELAYKVYYADQDYLTTGWLEATGAEQSDQNGNYWRDFITTNDTKFFVWLEVDVD